MSDRMLVSLFVTVLAIIGMFFLFDLCIDDESEPGDLGAPAWILRSEPPGGRDGPGRDGDCEDQCNNENGRDCYQAQAECSDDDGLIICVQPEACRFG